jgi:hypothetical protein
MVARLGTLFGFQPKHQPAPLRREPVSSNTRAAARVNGGSPSPAYTRVFRWRLPDGETEEPERVEIVGSFTNWQPVELQRDGKLDAWHSTIHHIPGNRTHHYMLLVDGQPSFDANSDGFAVPHGPVEEQYQLLTDKGMRVLMLFAQTK